MTVGKETLNRRRERVLADLSDAELETVIQSYGIEVHELVSGRRYSMIQSIVEWENKNGKQFSF